MAKPIIFITIAACLSGCVSTGAYLATVHKESVLERNNYLDVSGYNIFSVQAPLSSPVASSRPILLSSLTYPNALFKEPQIPPEDVIIPDLSESSGESDDVANDEPALEDEEPSNTDTPEDEQNTDLGTPDEGSDLSEAQINELEMEIYDSKNNPVITGRLYPKGNNNSVWEKSRRGFSLPDSEHPGVKGDLYWFVNNPDYLLRTSIRAKPYLHFVLEEIKSRGMPTEIALLPIVESAYQPFAYSHGRAAGIWQFIPGTGRLYGLKQNWWYDGRRDVYAATRAALTYLQNLSEMFEGDWLLALAAYNSGEGTVARPGAKNRKLGKKTDFWSLKLPRETRGYVPKLLALATIVNDPDKFSSTMLDISNEPYFALVNTESQLDLALAAELAELSTDEIYQLNPGFHRL